MAKEKQNPFEPIISARKSKGLSQSDAAEICGVTLRMWQYYEAGQHIPREFVMQSMLRAIQAAK